MQIKLLFLTTLFLWVFIPNSKSQIIFSSIYDNETYDKQSTLKSFGSGPDELIPSSISLREYAPNIRDQGAIGSCAGYSAGYAVMTINTASKYNITDKLIINKNAYSALFPFHNTVKADECREGTRFPMLMESLENDGNLTFNGYDNINPTSCSLINNSDLSKTTTVSKFKLFERHDKKETKIKALKKQLSEARAIAASFAMSESINTLFDSNLRKWKILPDEKIVGLHAMAIIGYDDTSQEFEIMNSYGESFGDQGYLYMDYDDVAERIVQAYTILPKSNFFGLQNDIEVEKINTELKVSLNLLKWEYPDYEQENLTVSKSDGSSVYLSQGAYNDGFRILVDKQLDDQHISVFSFNDGKDTLYMNWPDVGINIDDMLTGVKNTKTLGNISKNKHWAIPAPDEYMIIDAHGTEYIFILISDEAIDMNRYLKKLKAIRYSSNKISTFYTEFSADLIPSEFIEYSSDNLIATSKYKSSGKILPIILKLNKTK